MGWQQRAFDRFRASTMRSDPHQVAGAETPGESVQGICSRVSGINCRSSLSDRGSASHSQRRNHSHSDFVVSSSVRALSANWSACHCDQRSLLRSSLRRPVVRAHRFSQWERAIRGRASYVRSPRTVERPTKAVSDVSGLNVSDVPVAHKACVWSRSSLTHKGDVPDRERSARRTPRARLSVSQHRSSRCTRPCSLQRSAMILVRIPTVDRSADPEFWFLIQTTAPRVLDPNRGKWHSGGASTASCIAGRGVASRAPSARLVRAWRWWSARTRHAATR